MNIPQPRTGPLPYDFVCGRSDLEAFPFAMWRRLLRRSARRARTPQLDYGPAAGSVALWEAICSHSRRSRAVSCDPSQVLIVNGSQQALNLISRVLIEPGDLGDRIELSGDGAGAHVVLWLRQRVAEQAVITGAAARGVGVYPVSPYFLKPPPRSGSCWVTRACRKQRFARVSAAERSVVTEA